MLELYHIKTNKAFSKDDLHPQLYVEALHSSASIVCHIMNISLTIRGKFQSHSKNVAAYTNENNGKKV